VKYSAREVSNFDICVVWKHFDQKKKAVVVRPDAYIRILYVTHDMTESVKMW
jgi:hypothetical protein